MSDEYSVRGGWSNSISPIGELAAALAIAQGNIDNVKKDRVNPHFKSNYATLGSVWDTIRDELSKNGLSVIQLPCPSKDGHVGLRTILLHKSGQFIEETCHMPLKNASNPQDVGSALTYARRYALMALVGIAPEDDDGNAAKGGRQDKQDRAQTDWERAASDMLVVAGKSKDPAEVRAMYARVRNSQMPDPGKSALLSSLETIINSLTEGK